MTLWRGLQNRTGLELRRYKSLVSWAKGFLLFSVCTALIVVAALSDAHGQISYSLPIPLFPLARAENGEVLGGPLSKVIVDINGDGFQDAIYFLFTQGQLFGNGGPSPIVILLNDGKGGFYDGTSEIIAGPPPKAFWVSNFIVDDFNGDGRLDIFCATTGPLNPIPNPGEQNLLFLSASDGKLHDVTATHLPQLKDFSSASAADVDGDADIDIWVNNGGPGTDGRVETYLMLNDGTGRFTIVAQQGSGVFQPHVGFNGRIPEQIGGSYRTFFADTDNDGDPDLIMGYNGLPINPRVTVLINDGTGRFSLSAPNVIPFPPFGGTGLVSRAVAEDLNLDGYVDFILAVFPTLTATSANGHYFQVLINNGDGTFSDQTTARVPGQSDALRNDVLGPYFFLADLDGDGHKDLLAKFFADFYTGDTFPTQQDWKTEFYKNDGKGFFTRLPEGDYFHIEPIFFPLDVDGDGITDFVNPATNRFFASTGEFWASLIKATGSPRTLFAATLPSSRSVQVGQAATFFATVINAGTTEASGCVIDKLSGVKGNLSFQATDPSTNAPVGLPNTPVTIAAGGNQTFVVSVMPTAQFTSTEFALHFGCTNTTTARSRKGLNTVLLSASLTPIPDIVALAATTNNDGIVNIAGTNGTGAFAVATVNVGATGTITASADTGGLTVPVNISLCQTNSATGQCISGIGPSVTTTINANATPTFGIFVQASGNVPFDPAANRIFVRFKDGGNVTRGSTSVAVRTQ